MEEVIVDKQHIVDLEQENELKQRLLDEFKDDVLFKLICEKKKEQELLRKATFWLDTSKFYSTSELAGNLGYKSSSNIRQIIKVTKKYINPDDTANVYRFDYRGAFKLLMIDILKEEMKIPTIAEYVAKSLGYQNEEYDANDELLDRMDEMEKNQQHLIRTINELFEVDGQGKISVKSKFLVAALQSNALQLPEQTLTRLEDKITEYREKHNEVENELKQEITTLRKENESLAKEVDVKFAKELELQRKKDAALRKEALIKWSEKPDSERFLKKGFFRRVENLVAMEEFIQKYIEEYGNK
ncbi:hypothetical protein [Ammoniphilus sp. 3BR4]|uniref:hypothetical protein n=1 Tax=Ammoniphilus sp. 3BR4 TaxID=3158265 RepID=UPI003466875E